MTRQLFLSSNDSARDVGIIAALLEKIQHENVMVNELSLF